MPFRQLMSKFYNVLSTKVLNATYLKNGYNSSLIRFLSTPVPYEVVDDKEKKILSEG